MSTDMLATIDDITAAKVDRDRKDHGAGYLRTAKAVSLRSAPAMQQPRVQDMQRMSINAARAIERCERPSKLGSPPPQRHNRKLRKWLDAFAAIMALDISEHAEMLRGVYTKERLVEIQSRPNPVFEFMRKVRPGGKWVEPDAYDNGKALEDA